MTAFDVLNLYQTPFEWMLNSGIHIEDVSYVGLYKEYIRMKRMVAKRLTSSSIWPKNTGSANARYILCSSGYHKTASRLSVECM